MNDRLMALSPALWLFAFLGVSALYGCGANVGDAPAATPVVAKSESVESAASQDQTLNSAAIIERNFKTVVGQGNGVIMSELKGHGGRLIDTETRYDVFDAEVVTDVKSVRESIQVSLDRGNDVLIDGNGSAQARENLAEIALQSAGAAVPDLGALIIRKAPEDKGGFLIIPIYSKAEVAQQVAQGGVARPEDVNNSVTNFFFH